MRPTATVPTWQAPAHLKNGRAESRLRLSNLGLFVLDDSPRPLPSQVSKARWSVCDSTPAIPTRSSSSCSGSAFTRSALRLPRLGEPRSSPPTRAGARADGCSLSPAGTGVLARLTPSRASGASDRSCVSGPLSPSGPRRATTLPCFGGQGAAHPFVASPIVLSGAPHSRQETSARAG